MEKIVLHQIKTLLRNGELRGKVRGAASRADAIDLLVSAGAAEGYNFRAEDVAQVFTDLGPARPRELTEDELLGVSGGAMTITMQTRGCPV
jgi:hypothetical protein